MVDPYINLIRTQGQANFKHTSEVQFGFGFELHAREVLYENGEGSAIQDPAAPWGKQAHSLALAGP